MVAVFYGSIAQPQFDDQKTAKTFAVTLCDGSDEFASFRMCVRYQIGSLTMEQFFSVAISD